MYNRMTNYDRNLFAILTIYLMRIASVNPYHFIQYTPHMTDYKPFWKFHSFMQDQMQYHCYQKCIPTIVTQPQTMVELCNKICPFKPNIPECTHCPRIYEMIAISNQQETKLAEPEAMLVDPTSHVIIFKPEIVIADLGRKQCCYLDQCELVNVDETCETRCYEPCDAVCTGRCRLNPQCPNQCEIIRQEQFRIKYKIWLVQKLNEIKRKYRAMAIACLLKTRLAFVKEVQSLNDSAREVLVGNAIVHPQIQDEVERINSVEHPELQLLNLPPSMPSNMPPMGSPQMGQQSNMPPPVSMGSDYNA